MNSINNGARRIIYRLSRFTQKNHDFAETEETKERFIREDTAELPSLQDLLFAQYGFRVEEDITFVHTTEKI